MKEIQEVAKQSYEIPQTAPVDNKKPVTKVKNWAQALRIHQWTKNLLLFLPALMAHRILEIPVLIELILAFISFSFCASAIYVINDLLDLEADRQHSVKKNRPFASGALSLRSGMFAVPVLLLASFGIAVASLSVAFIGILLLYIMLTVSYSLYFKQKTFIDVLLLAGLYAFRMLAGAVAVSIPISSWLLAFSMFFFLSLALMKRFADLAQLEETQKKLHRRSYYYADIQIIQTIGLVSGYLAILVMAFYIHSEHIKELYPQPVILWLSIPFMMYWITRMWLLTARGHMTSDPIVFTFKDKVSYITGSCILLVFLFAKFVGNIPIQELILITP